MKIKYQVFVSSTYEDLSEERDIVIKAILELGHIPVGMEMFSAGDEQQWELIKRQIDDCDYYVVIAAHRYGSTDGTISYTEKEYDYAAQSAIPILGFIISDEANWPKSKMDEDTVKQQALVSFKDKLKKKIVNFWNTAEDLHAKVAIALSKATTAYPRPGWIRATATAGPDVMNELSRLSKENAELRTARALSDAKRKTETEEEHRKILSLLKRNIVKPSFFFKGDEHWTSGAMQSNLFSIFEFLAPELMVERSVQSISAVLAVSLRPEKLKPQKELRAQWPMPSNGVKGWLADFHALGLIMPSPKKHQVKDTNEYWTITDLGKTIYNETRIVMLEGASEGPTTVLAGNRA